MKEKNRKKIEQRQKDCQNDDVKKGQLTRPVDSVSSLGRQQEQKNRENWGARKK